MFFVYKFSYSATRCSSLGRACKSVERTSNLRKCVKWMKKVTLKCSEWDLMQGHWWWHVSFFIHPSCSFFCFSIILVVYCNMLHAHHTQNDYEHVIFHLNIYHFEIHHSSFFGSSSFGSTVFRSTAAKKSHPAKTNAI